MIETWTSTASCSARKLCSSVKVRSLSPSTLRRRSFCCRPVRLFGLPPPCGRGARSPLSCHWRSIFLTKAGQTPKREAISEIEPTPCS